MLYLFQLLLLLISFDQEKVPSLFRMEDPSSQKIVFAVANEATLNMNRNIYNTSFNAPYEIFLTLLKLIEDFREKIQDGLTLADIENLLFFILFIRFVILAIRYNLKTSFYITFIGLIAGYFWYRHLIDLISMYRSILLRLPFLAKLGMDALQFRTIQKQMVLTDVKLEGNAHWYNPGQVLSHAVKKGIIHVNPETGLKYYIDPISMLITNLPEPLQLKVLPLYYDLYQKIIPKMLEIGSKFWTQFSGIAAYVVITRMGKRYCPYLIRWHWTFLLMIGLLEQVLQYFIYRVSYFQTFVLMPQTKLETNDGNLNLIVQIKISNFLIAFVVLTHIGLILFGLFHAIWGQYFYIPFLVENTELHVGFRPTNSIYSAGNTAWQNPNEKMFNPRFPKLWYGWFGRGTTNRVPIQKNIWKFVKKFWKTVKKRFRR